MTGPTAPPPPPLAVAGLFTLLAALRPLSFSHGRSARAFARAEQERLASEQAEIARIAEEARLAAEAEAKAAAAAAAAAAKAAAKKGK